MKSPLRKRKILVVDANRELSSLLCLLLEREGYQAHAVYDAEQSLTLAQQDPPDLITLNADLPKVDGFEVCRRLKAARNTKKVPVFLFGEWNGEQMVRAYDLGADEYLALPFEGQIFLALVRKSLRVPRPTNFARRRTPRVFISYKWGSNDHNDWVMHFAVDLRTAGLNVSLDQWGVRFGDSFSEYMTSKIKEADVVLFVMTAASVAAVEAAGRKGGAVKFEMQLAKSREIAGENLRIVPIYKEGNKTASYVKDSRYADFRDDSKYQSELQKLVLDLLDTARK